MKQFFRWLSVVPAIFMLLLIFGFSAQDGPSSGSLSYRVCCMLLSFADHIFHLNLSAPTFAAHAESMQFFVRKTAHVTEYFLLTLSMFLPLRVWIPKSTSSESRNSFLLRYLLPAFLLSVLCAAADEFHQSFVPGRCGTPIDVLVDSIGVTLACILLLLCRRRMQKKAHHE